MRLSFQAVSGLSRRQREREEVPEVLHIVMDCVDALSWRRGWDSNPYALSGYCRFSKPGPYQLGLICHIPPLLHEAVGEIFVLQTRFKASNSLFHFCNTPTQWTDCVFDFLSIGCYVIPLGTGTDWTSIASCCVDHTPDCSSRNTKCFDNSLLQTG